MQYSQVKTDLKYGIQERLEELPKKDYRPTIDQLCKLLELSLSQFNRIRFRKSDDPAQIGDQHLLRLAEFFNCTTDEILKR